MANYISRLPDELLLDIALALSNKDQLNLDCTSRGIPGPAIEALFCNSGSIPQLRIPWYISRVNKRHGWAMKIRHLTIRQSRHDAVCYHSKRTVQRCNQAIASVLQNYPSSQALVQEVNDILNLDRPQTTTRDASSWSLLLLVLLGVFSMVRRVWV